MSKDLYRYFRVEARELLQGLTDGVLALEQGESASGIIDRLLRIAHTLKGAARVVKQGEVAELSHAIEELLTPHRELTKALPPEIVSQVLAMVDECSDRLQPVLSDSGTSTKPPPTEPASSSRPTTVSSQPASQTPIVPNLRTPQQEPPPDQPVSSVRVEFAEIDAILEEMAGAATRLEKLGRDADSLATVADQLRSLVDIAARARSRDSKISQIREFAENAESAILALIQSISSSVNRSLRDARELRSQVSDLRLLPARELFAPLSRTARDAAQTLQKQVNFETEGGDHRLESHALRSLRDALVQVVRNAVAHGIESPSERERKGKPPAGRVTFRVSKRGGRVLLAVIDDGRGVDLHAVRHQVVQRGIVSPGSASQLSDEEANRFLFQPGFSTAASVTELMGRGIGLDLVRSITTGLKGEVDLQSEPGRGTVVEISVPLSLESTTTVEFQAGTWSGLLPFDSILKTLRVKDAEIVQTPTGQRLLHDGKAIPFRPLTEVLGGTQMEAEEREGTAIVLQSGAGDRAAIGVDRIGGVRTITARPVPTLAGPTPLVDSITLDAAGVPVAVFDPAAISQTIHSTSGRVVVKASAPQPPILVVDDSLTTRMLEQSILEAAGFEVHLATSGEEALEKAAGTRYALFLVDVEMPGMSGFELLERFRADPALRDIPSILVTSLASPDHRLRGEQAGARAHIAKGEFNEEKLLQTIRRLIGGGHP